MSTSQDKFMGFKDLPGQCKQVRLSEATSYSAPNTAGVRESGSFKYYENVRPISEDSNTISLSTCRNCSEAYSYTFPDGQIVTIIVGIPGPDLKYKAISHVWGNTIPILMLCKKCSRSFAIPLRSTSTFHNIIAMAGPGSAIWLDNMSIDQSNHKEKATVIKAMGEIYAKAECVSVLFPAEDAGPFQILRSLVAKASTLLERKWRFDYRVDESVGLEGDDDVKTTATLARSFWTHVKKLLESDVKYWQRAWTFQEWALAHDIELSCDLVPSKGSIITVVKEVKSRIVFAAIIIANYKLRFGQFALMDVGFTRGEITNRMDFVKTMFPFEDAFASFEEISNSKLQFECALPHFGTNHILGLRPAPRVTREGDMAFRARLFLMLDAFATRGMRKATREADLVCCWASMCNIDYEYSERDKLPTALAKVIRALRKRGIKIYNFQVNGDEHGLDVDLQFFDYAAAQPQASSTCRQRMLGAPIFTGCTDTLTHFLSLTGRPVVPMDWPLGGKFCGISVRGIKGALIKAAIPLTSKIYALGAMQAATSGIADGIVFTHGMGDVQNAIESMPTKQLLEYAVIIVAIPTSPDLSNTSYFCAWAIITLYMPVDSLFVAREELNGTLVLAAVKEGSANPASIFAYLTLTDHQCGTSLIRTSSEGTIDMMFTTPPRPDVTRSNSRDRRLLAQLEFADNNELSRASRRYVDMHFPGIIYDKRIDESERLKSFETNDAVIQPFGEDSGLEILRETIRRQENGEFEKHTTVDLDIIGHSHLIPLAQQEQEGSLRQRAAVPREVNKDAHDRLSIIEIPTAFGSMSFTKLQGPYIGSGIPGIEDPVFKLQEDLSAIQNAQGSTHAGPASEREQEKERKRYEEDLSQRAVREIMATHLGLFMRQSSKNSQHQGASET